MAKAHGRFRPNSKGFRDLLTSAEIQGQLDRVANGAADTANRLMGPKGPTDLYGYRATTRDSPTRRAAAYVRTGGYASRKDNAKNNTLVRSVLAQTRKVG
jgi:hypothetical protein